MIFLVFAMLSAFRSDFDGGFDCRTFDGQSVFSLVDQSADVQIVGNLGQLVLTLTYENPSDVTLAGNFELALLGGQTLVGFGLEIEGQMRPAVAIEKNRGKEVFEAVKREAVDPGLLEKVSGNNFNFSIYPFEAHGRRTIQIHILMEGFTESGGLRFVFPQANRGVKHVQWDISVQSQVQPKFTDQANNWKHQGTRWRSQGAGSSFPSGLWLDHLPEDWVGYGQCPSGETVFSGAISCPLGAEQSANRPVEHLGILWDVSASHTASARQKEKQLLDLILREPYLRFVSLIPFNYEMGEPQTIGLNREDPNQIHRILDGYLYDGASNCENLDLEGLSAESFLLFSDGLVNFGWKTQLLSSRPVWVITASVGADSLRLNQMTRDGGLFLDLNLWSPQEAFRQYKGRHNRFLGFRVLKGQVDDFYPEMPETLVGEFKYYGHLLSSEALIQLLFEDGSGKSFYRLVRLKQQPGLTAIGALWAQRHFQSLIKTDFESAVSFAKQAQIATDYTSLIVLETAEDYCTFNIEPPPDFMAAYSACREAQAENQQEEREDYLEERNDQLMDRTEWLESEYPAVVPLMKFRPSKVESDGSNRNQSISASQTTQPSLIPTPEGAVALIKGVVADESGSGLPGVVVALNPGNQAGVTGENGAFQLAIPVPGQISMEASLLGFNSAVSSFWVQPATSYQLDLKLFPSSIEEVMVVTAESTILATDFLAIEAWQADAPYLECFRSTDSAYWLDLYGQFRPHFQNSPGFFLDVADLFWRNDQASLAIQILSNLAELNLENPPVLTALANRLVQWGQADWGLPIFQKILELRPFEPQSYRNLGLCYAALGETQNALHYLALIGERTWDSRFAGIEWVVANDIRALFAGRELPSQLKPFFKGTAPLDLRIVLAWDSNDVDLDLHVVDPFGEEVSYRNDTSRIGGFLAFDYQEGYGPEEFLLKTAPNGEYFVLVDFYDDHSQTLLGPVTYSLEIFENFGGTDQKVAHLSGRLEGVDETKMVARFTLRNQESQ